MSTRIGVNDEEPLYNRPNTSKLIKIETGPNYHRIIAGKKIKKTRWIPILMDDRTTGDQKKVAISFNCYENSILDELQKAENDAIIQAKLSVRSNLIPTIRFLYIVIARGLQNSGQDYIRYVEYPLSVQKSLEVKCVMKDQYGKLKYGPLGSWDHITTKLSGKRIEYTVDVDRVCPITPAEMEQIDRHRTFIRSDCPLGGGCYIKCKDYDKEKCVVQHGEDIINLYELTRPSNPDDILQTLQRYIFDLDSVMKISEKQKRKRFVQPKALIPILEKYGIKYVYTPEEKPTVQPEPQFEPEENVVTQQQSMVSNDDLKNVGHKINDEELPF